MGDFLITPIYLPTFEERVCCRSGGMTGVRSEGSENYMNSDDPDFPWQFVVWQTISSRTIEFGICCSKNLEIDINYQSLDADEFVGVFKITVEDDDGTRVIFDASQESLPLAPFQKNWTITEEVQPRACGVIVTIEGEVTDEEQGVFTVDDLTVS